MKYVVCVPDGCADEPLAALGDRTPLEVASMPTLRSLARRGRVGRAAVIPPGLSPGSDVGNMSIFGYDPARFHTGRAPIEAAAYVVVAAGLEESASHLRQLSCRDGLWELMSKTASWSWVVRRLGGAGSVMLNFTMRVSMRYRSRMRPSTRSWPTPSSITWPNR